jgi:DHA3 family macrolide efflux protein-like MFS transporter
VLRNRKFLLYEASAIASTTGYAVYSIAIPWLAYLNSGSFLVVGLVLFLEIGIYSLTFLAAPLVDRAEDKRFVFLIGYPIQAVAAGILAYAAAHGELSLGLLLLLVSVLAVAWDFEWAVFQVAPRLLLPKDELFAGQGLAGALGGGVQVGGYAVGAGLILLSGAAGSGYLYAGLLIVATLLASLVALRGGRSTEREYLAGFLEGWRYLLGTREGRPLLQLGVLDGVEGFFAAAPPVLITLFAGRVFANPSLAYGVLFTAFVVGGVVMDLLLGHFNPRGRVGAVLVGGLSVSAVALYLTGVFPPSLVLTASAWFVAGLAMGAYYSGKNTFLWGYVPANRLARVTSNLYVFPGVSGAIGAIALGVLATRIVPGSLTTLAALVFAGAALMSVLLPAVRKFAF